MSAVRIKFTAQGSNSMIGGFSTGDVATVDEEIARHLVEEARVATYAANPGEQKPAVKVGRSAKKAAE